MSAAASGASDHDRKALVKALRDGEADEVSVILERRPNLVTTLTPQPLVHLAVTAPSHAPRMFTMLLEAGAPIDATNSAGLTALHMASMRGVSSCVRKLLRAGADVNYQDSDGRIPLFYAARSRHEHAKRCLRMLLEAGSSLDVPDTYGMTPLHAAVEAGNQSKVEMLLKAGASHACRDNSGNTPLHLASSSRMAEALLAAGADIMAPDNLQRSPLDNAIRYKSSLAQAMLGAGVAVQGDLREADVRVYFHLNLLSSGSHGEVKLLNTMVTRDQVVLLKHPLCETFLHLKWLIVSPLFYVKLAVYICLVAALTGDVCIRSVLPPENNATRDVSANATGTETTHQVLLVMATICQSIAAALLILVALRAVALMVILKSRHWRRLEKWVEVVFCGCSVVLLVMDGPLRDWERHVAVFSLLLGWFQITVLMGHIPAIGIYVQMFQAVAVRVLTFIFIYSSLFVAFTVSFHLAFEAEVFGSMTTSALKTLSMMIGELDFADILGPEAPDVLPGTAQIVFVMFVLVMIIVVTNLLVGLAVQDIHELQKEAGIRRLALTVEQEESVDRVLRSILLSTFLPASVSSWLRNRFSLLFHFPARPLFFQRAGSRVVNLLGFEWNASTERYNVFIRPNDRLNPGQVYCGIKSRTLVPTGYNLPSWIVRNTRALLDANGMVESSVSELTDDEYDDNDMKKEPITLEALQDQISELKSSLGNITQILQKLTEDG